jgi:hypothetical protein
MEETRTLVSHSEANVSHKLPKLIVSQEGAQGLAGEEQSAEIPKGDKAGQYVPPKLPWENEKLSISHRGWICGRSTSPTEKANNFSILLAPHRLVLTFMSISRFSLLCLLLAITCSINAERQLAGT